MKRRQALALFAGSPAWAQTSASKDKKPLPPPSAAERLGAGVRQLGRLVGSVGEEHAAREMRKHVAWYLAQRPSGREFLRRFHALESGAAQLLALHQFFQEHDEKGVMAA